ncbi:LOW QUALITY PROTEIN: hypothetical protein OSB04_015870 [Centaurea solstitialis]|uniref:F-box domain-containing protein n=1 Tax=Centaurea solstitialis TaxID=347529 RepID=A0AA38WGX5_9ASTR|nr:LOW QUALITY PROTEIN: hypothetical protein OSB04_015870 [Centaurea solstitialis]
MEVAGEVIKEDGGGWTWRSPDVVYGSRRSYRMWYVVVGASPEKSSEKMTGRRKSLRSGIDPSMEDLPAELTIDILSRLPVKTVIHCKCVCKKWRNLVLDSSFVNLHLSRSPTGLLFQQRVSGPGILKWVEIEEKVDDHRLHPMSLDLNMVPVFRNCEISGMGSVDGLICLRQYSRRHDNTFICNPVTREIMTISNPPYYRKDFEIKAYGFGVASSTGEYKVVRTFKWETWDDDKFQWVNELGAEVYTLGTGQWRRLGRVPYKLYGYDFGVVLNDHCHWIVSRSEDAPEKICAFDLNKETFQFFPAPSETTDSSQSLAVLKGCLCKSDGNRFPFTIWVMKEYGIKKSWHKEVVITEEALNSIRAFRYYKYPIYLIGFLKDTMFFMGGDLFAFYPTSDTIEKIESFEGSRNGLAYRSSFLKLQNFESETVHIRRDCTCISNPITIWFSNHLGCGKLDKAYGDVMESRYSHLQRVSILVMDSWLIFSSWRNPDVLVYHTSGRGLKDGTIFLRTGDLWEFYPTSHTIEEIDTCEGLESPLAYRPSFLKLQDFESEKKLSSDPVGYKIMDTWEFSNLLHRMAYRLSFIKLRNFESERSYLLKEYGINNSWHKEVVIILEISNDMILAFRPLHLIAGLKDGSILMVFEGKLCVFDPRSETIEDTKIFNPNLRGLAYRPSFLKLKNFESERHLKDT